LAKDRRDVLRDIILERENRPPAEGVLYGSTTADSRACSRVDEIDRHSDAITIALNEAFDDRACS
jgi:hypothetical protein